MQQPDSTNFGDRLSTGFAQVFGQTLPALLGALVILFAGYLLAKVLEKLTERGLRKIRLNHLLERGGVTQAVERSGTHVNPTRVLANLVFWLVMFTVILLAANALGLESLANVVSTLVSYIPSVIAAIVIILIGIVLGGFVGGLIAASAGGPSMMIVDLPLASSPVTTRRSVCSKPSYIRRLRTIRPRPCRRRCTSRRRLSWRPGACLPSAHGR